MKEGTGLFSENSQPILLSPRVLLIEDDPITQKVHRYYLEQLGFQVDQVMLGRQALDCIGRSDYNVILLDVSLPDMMGDEILLTIRRHELATGKHTLVIMSTAHGDASEVEAYYLNGADSVLIKPVGWRDFKQYLESIYLL